MRLAVFGATGRTGRRVVEYALADGHDVTALVRDPSRLGLVHERLTVLTGDVLDPYDAARAVDGSDAVASALGVANGAMPGTALSDGMRHIVDAMRACGVSRILAVANSGVLDDDRGRLRCDDPSFPPMYLPITREHVAAWRALAGSDRAWTLVCPPDLVSGERTGRVRAIRDRLPDGATHVSVEDVAGFIVESLRGDEWTGARVGVGY